MLSNKKQRQEWDEQAMEEALRNIREKKMGWLLAAKTFKVPATTLRRRFAKNKGGEKGDVGGRRTILSAEIENELANHICDMETRFFGLTTKALRKLVYQIAEEYQVKHNFNKETQMAGKKWVRGFLNRNLQISLRRPENTSLARATAFNKPNILAYFSALAKILDQYQFPPENIYNVDESGLSTVQKRPQKIFATKGRKQVGTLSSAERGQHFTVVCAMNAIGNFVPPAFIFPRKRFKNELMDNAPPGSTAFCQEKGWMNSEIFLKWIKHFAHYTKASKDNKVLLLLDGHSSHKSLEVLRAAKDFGIVLFCFPAHCTHRVQPLDVGFFGPLQTYYDQEVQKWLKQNPTRLVTHLQVAGLFTKAFLKSATPLNAIRAFAKTGIQPFNPDIFEDWMFKASLTTEKPAPEPRNDTAEPESTSTSDFVAANQMKNDCSSAITTNKDDNQQWLNEDLEVPSWSSRSPMQIIHDLSPVPSALPKAETKKRRQRGKVGLLNGTPEIKIILEKEADKAAQERQRQAKRAKKQLVEEISTSKQTKQRIGLPRNSRKQKINKDSENKHTESNDESDPYYCSSDESEAACLYCNDLYSRSKSREMWIRCVTCQSWCHSECAGVSSSLKKFVCDICM